MTALVVVRALAADEVAAADARLPLHRLDQGNGFYLVAWDRAEPIGHAHLALTDPPELQDVFVIPAHRRLGVATQLTRAAEAEATRRGHERLRLTVSVDNEAARRLYGQLGYVDAGLHPKRVRGTIRLRGEPFEVDDTLLTLEKRLRPDVDFRGARSSSSRNDDKEGTMQYMLLIYGSDDEWASLPDEEREVQYQEYFQLSADLESHGAYVSAHELQPASTATVVRVRDGETLITDGPFAETKETLGGYYLVEAESLEEAIEWAKRIPAARGGAIEVRPVVMREAEVQA